jgi:hypothetical protein
MRKALISILVLVMLIVAGVALAQEPAAPSPTPMPAAPATPAAPAAPATPAPPPAKAAPAPSLNITQMEIAGSVENREPVDVASTFPDTTKMVFCFVEIKDAPKDTSITFVWTMGTNEMGKVTQQVMKSSRWRTWSSKTVSGMKGDWRVDVVDEAGAVLKSATFKVE